MRSDASRRTGKGRVAEPSSSNVSCSAIPRLGAADPPRRPLTDEEASGMVLNEPDRFQADHFARHTLRTGESRPAVRPLGYAPNRRTIHRVAGGVLSPWPFESKAQPKNFQSRKAVAGRQFRSTWPSTNMYTT